MISRAIYSTIMALAVVIAAVVMSPVLIVLGIGAGVRALWRWSELHTVFGGDASARDREEWKRR